MAKFTHPHEAVTFVRNTAKRSPLDVCDWMQCIHLCNRCKVTEIASRERTWWCIVRCSAASNVSSKCLGKSLHAIPKKEKKLELFSSWAAVIKVEKCLNPSYKFSLLAICVTLHILYACMHCIQLRTSGDFVLQYSAQTSHLRGVREFGRENGQISSVVLKQTTSNNFDIKYRHFWRPEIIGFSIKFVYAALLT